METTQEIDEEYIIKGTVMKTKKQKVHKIDTESELEISDNKESDSSSSERVVKYICKKKKLHKKRKVKKVPSSEDSTGTSD